MPMIIPEAYMATLAHVRAVFPDAVIAGGAIRDLDNDRPVKDVDIFAPNCPDFETTSELIRQNLIGSAALMQSSPDRGYDNWAVGDVAGVFDIKGAELAYQLICLNVPADRILPRIDFGICRIAYDGDMVIRTDEYHADKHNERFTLHRCDDDPQFKRSLLRYDRLVEKYPGWHLAVAPHLADRFAVPIQGNPDGPR